MDISGMNQAELQELGRQIGTLPPSKLHDVLQAVVGEHERRHCYSTRVGWHIAMAAESTAPFPGHREKSEQQMMG